jgi:hypothetical protein
VSQIALGQHGHAHDDAHAPHVQARKQLDLSAVTLAPGAGAMLSNLLLLIGVVGLVVVGFTATRNVQHALAAYQMGFVYAVGLAVVCLGMQMIFQQFNAGWSAAVRRQAENVASCIWVCALLFLPVAITEIFITHGKLFHWMDPHVVDPASPHFDYLIDKKKAFLNAPFWAARAVLYFGIWMFLAHRLRSLSLEQDATGDKWLTAKARRISSVGLLLFALTAAFASFDWLMSLDPHWFSTMFGVYFFAGAMRAAVALIIVILGFLMIRGKLGKAYTIEHLHDTGKLLFAFTVFWAYITFCQYFLIWYSNIPEETAFYNKRLDPERGWQPFPVVLVVFNFVIPFLLLLIRNVKRNPRLLVPVALICLVAYAMDLYFIVRPIVSEAKPWSNILVDVAGIIGPLAIFLGVVVRRVASTPLVPLKDPRLHEVLEHKNYV